MYSLIDADSAGNQVDWLIIDNQNGGLNPGDGDEIIIYFNGSELQTGLYEADIIITDHINNEYIVPVWFYVDLTIGIVENSLISGMRSIPNPFSENTVIQFILEKDTPVNIDIFNSRGEKVRSLVESKSMQAGTHRIKWDATNDEGNRVKSGIYYYRIFNQEIIYSGKMILFD